jgi:uncharacterized damage-inducible protein DinB
MTMQEFLANAAEKAAADLVAAYLRIPEDKRTWAPSEKSRSAHDQFVECAQLNGGTVHLLENQKWLGNMDDYMAEKKRISALSWDELKALLDANTAKVAATIRGLSDESLPIEIPMPWGTQTVGSIAAYPYWNMTYHLGQITQIGMILGVED